MINAFLFSLLCFALTSVGACSVIFVRKKSKNLEAILHSFSAGVMIASAIFSLIIPAISYCDELNLSAYIILPLCFFLAYVLFYFLDMLIKPKSDVKVNRVLLCAGIGLHNIPEGMCVGFAFASASILGTDIAYMSAVMISVGIAIQNMPEGSSVAFPLFSSGYKKGKAVLVSVLIGFIEVPSAIIAYAIGLNFILILPYMLAFSAAIMIYVATGDLMPEAVDKNKKLSLLFLFLGFSFMMFLDLFLG